tara:strand:+ start:215 stop:748 length:534 start_codon:yes stop_codon:yes gene_type:complete
MIHNTGISYNNIAILNIEDIINECKVDIDNDLHFFKLDNNNSAPLRDITSIVYHYILHTVCEGIQRLLSERCIVIYQPRLKLSEYICVSDDILSFIRTFRDLSKCIPATCYIYDGRYGDITLLDRESGEFKEIVHDALSQNRHATLKGALKFSRESGLTYMYKDYFKQPSIQLLFCK